MKTKNITAILIGMIIILAIACTKTEAYEALPANRILEYKITNLSDTVLYASIDNIENTITVYIPFYYGMSVIDPEIILERGAQLKSENIPVSVTDTAYTYTVTSSEGISRTYKLIIFQKSHVPMNLFLPSNNHNPENQFTIMGDFMSTSTETLELYLVNRRTKGKFPIDKNKPTSIELNTSFYDLPHSYLLKAHLTLDIDSGAYDIHINHLGRSEVVQQPLLIEYVNPTIASLWSPLTVKPGGEISFQPGAGRLLIDPKSVHMTINSTVYELTILPKSTRKMIYVQLPQNVPLGNHGYIPFVFRFGEWNPVTSNVPIIISAE